MIVVDTLKSYIDAQIKPAARRFGRSWCHLEDTENDTDRLHAFAAKIGIPRRWFQSSLNGSFPHYDLTPRYRLRAIQAGAVEMSEDRTVRLTVAKVKTNRHFPKDDFRYGKKLDRNGRVIGVHAQPRRLRTDTAEGATE